MSNEIRDTDYRVWHDEASATLCFEGSIRLRPHDYEPLWSFIVAALDRRPPALTLDLSKLVFLNSSGINAIYKLAVEMRKRGGVKLVVVAGDGAWQKKSLPNLKRFLPDVELRQA
jgi:hypothetical protein